MAAERALQPQQPGDASTNSGSVAITTNHLSSPTAEELVDRLQSALESWTTQEKYAARYAQLALEHDPVEAVYADTTHGLTLYTVYRGDRRSVAPALYESYQRIIDEFPDVTADFRLLGYDRLDTAPLPNAARLLLSRV